MTQRPSAQQPASESAAPRSTEPQSDAATVESDAHAPKNSVSGLRNPAAAIRGVGVGTLALESLVLLLALQPMRQLGSVSTPVALSVVGGLAVLLVVNAMLLRRHSWAWKLGLALQVAIGVAGLIHLALLVLGVVFLLIWIYVLRVRRTVLGPPET